MAELVDALGLGSSGVSREGSSPFIDTYGSMVESVDTPDLKSVEHYARGSSSLPAPIRVLL